VQDGPGAIWLLGHQLVEQLVLLDHVGMQGDRPGDDLLGAKAVERGEVGFPPGLLELGDVGAQLLPWLSGGVRSRWRCARRSRPPPPRAPASWASSGGTAHSSSSTWRGRRT
jgi:hypothetical protein